jgi:hypothetical protein
MNMDEKERLRRGIGGGAVAGVVAGLILALFLTVMNLTHGQDLWVGLKGAALPFLGERVHQPGFDAVAVMLGVLCHTAVSVGWGVLFGAIAYGFSKGLTVAAGVVWGVVVWLGMYYAVLPAVGAGDLPRSIPVANAIASHVLFGITMALAFLPFQRAVARTPSAPTEFHAPQPR